MVLLLPIGNELYGYSQQPHDYLHKIELRLWIRWLSRDSFRLLSKDEFGPWNELCGERIKDAHGHRILLARKLRPERSCSQCGSFVTFEQTQIVTGDLSLPRTKSVHCVQRCHGATLFFRKEGLSSLQQKLEIPISQQTLLHLLDVQRVITVLTTCFLTNDVLADTLDALDNNAKSLDRICKRTEMPSDEILKEAVDLPVLQTAMECVSIQLLSARPVMLRDRLSIFEQVEEMTRRLDICGDVQVACDGGSHGKRMEFEDANQAARKQSKPDVSQNVSIRHGYFCDIPSAQTAMDICAVSRGLSEPACYLYPAQKLVQPDGSFIVRFSTPESYVETVAATCARYEDTHVAHIPNFGGTQNDSCDVFEKYTNMCDRLLANNDNLTLPFIPSKDTTTICPSGSTQHGRARGKTQPTPLPVEAVDRLSIGMADTHHVSHEQITSELSHTKDMNHSVFVTSSNKGFASALAVLVIGASQSRQHGKSESDSYYLSD
ncbi:hypothetical protein Tco_1186387 [Tanacetum coccineum]